MYVCMYVRMYVCMYVCRFQNVLRCPTPRLYCFLSSQWLSFRFLSFMAFLIPSIQFFFGLPRALFCLSWHCWDLGFESRWGHRCSSLLLVVCCGSSGLWDKLITRSEELKRTDVINTGDSVSTARERKTAFTIRNTMTINRSSFFSYGSCLTLLKRTQFKYYWNTTSCWMVTMSITKLSDWKMDTPLQRRISHKNFKCFCKRNGDILHVLYWRYDTSSF